MRKNLRFFMLSFLLTLVGNALAGEPVKVLTFPDYNDSEVSSYTVEWTATVNGDVWNLSGFNNNKNQWSYVRCGRKNNEHVAKLTSPAVAGITNVVVTIDKTSNVEQASIVIKKGEETIKEIDVTERFAAGDLDIEVESGEGYSYQLVIVSNAEATANGTTQISKVALYGEGQAGSDALKWDFTKWSEATIANLKADAAASKTTGWSDVEKAADAQADAEPTETSKDNCFWLQADANVDGSLSANGVVIEELKGLVFNNDYALKRSLAIAVNYPVALSEYAGGAYLWLGGGGSKQTFPCFTIPNVAAGSTITMEIESHKMSDARGVGLYANSFAEENLIGEQFKPTTKASNTWTIPTACDVVVWNTSGCHIYNITISAGTPEKPAVPEAADIAAFKALEKGTEAKLTLNNAYVTAVSGNNAYVQDATGALYFYNTGLTLEAGKVLNGTVIGKLDNYNGLPEFAKTADTNADGFTVADGTASAKAATVAETLAPENISMLVKVAGTTIEEEGKYYAVDGESKIQIYDQFKVLAEGFQYPAKADITGVVGMYKGTPQLYPLDANSITEASAANETILDITIDHERATGLGYTPTEAEVDFTEAMSWLGVDAITTDMLRIENPDGELISDYAPFDGWFNGDGVAENWGTNTKVCVKFFEAVSGGKFTFYDMNSADEPGKTYTVKWQLVNGEKAVRYTINVKFFRPAAEELEIVDKGIVTSVSYDIAEGSYVLKEAKITDDEVAAICAELGISSLSEATIYGYNPTEKELVKSFTGFDGWRDANGDFHNWSGNSTVPACVKINDNGTTDNGQTYYCYNIGGCEPQTIKTYWALANSTKAVLVEIDFIYFDATADPNNLVKNWNCSGSDVSSFWVHEWRTMDAQTDGPAILADGCAKVYVRSFAQAEAAGNATLVDASKPVAADNFADWDSQFFITWDESKATAAGDKLQLKMKVKADKDITIGSQVHKAPGAYVHWYGVGDINVTTDWTDFVSSEVDVVSGDPGWGKTAEGCWTIAFNLAKGEENTLYFDDMVVYVIDPSGITETHRVVPTNGVTYNLAGQKVKNPTKGGIYIINGKKVMMK